MKIAVDHLYPEPAERRIYRVLSLILLTAAIAFLLLRFFKLSRAGAEINFSVEVIRVSVNFGLLILFSPIPIHAARISLKRSRLIVPIMIAGLILYLLSYAIFNNIANYFIRSGTEFDILKNFRKLAINFGHLAILSFSAIAAVAYWSLRKLTVKHILLKDLQGTHSKVDLSDIIMVKSDDHYQKIYTRDKFFYVRDTISQFYERLADDNFKRVHRSAIVNLSEIVHFIPNGNGEFYLEMSNGENVKVSRSYKEEIRSYLEQIK